MLGLGLGFSSSSVQGGNGTAPFVTLDNKTTLYDSNNGVLINNSTSLNTYLDVNQVVQTGAAAAIRLDYTNGGTVHTLHEGATTNWLTYNRDLAHADWSKNNMSAAKTATGADEVTNSATTITADAANATILQTLTRTSSVRISSAFVKRRTGSGTIEMTQNGGTLWTAVTVTGSWTKVDIPSATLANPSIGFRVVTSGDEIDVDYVQHEEQLHASSSIETTSAAASRDLDNIKFPLSLNTNWFNDYVIVLFRYRPQHDSTNTVEGILSVSNNADSVFGYSAVADQIRFNDSTTVATITQAFSADDVVYIALMCDGTNSKLGVSVNEGAFTYGASVAYDGSFSTGTDHVLFYSNDYINHFEGLKYFRKGLSGFTLSEMETWVDENAINRMVIS